MDNLALQAIVMEFQDCWRGREVVRIRCPGEHHYHFHLGPPRSEHLVVSVHPGMPGLFPTLWIPGVLSPPAGTFSRLLCRVLQGAVLATVEKRFSERQVRFSFRDASWREGKGPAILVAELIGRSANLILLREDGSVSGVARHLKSEFRSHTPGETYRDPPPRGSGNFFTMGPGDLLRRLQGVSGDSSLPEAILEAVSPVLLGAVKRGVEPGRWGDFVRETIRAFLERRYSPVLYLPLPRADLAPGDPLDSTGAFFFPFPLPHTGPLEEERFPTVLSAVDTLLGLLSRHLRFQAEKQAIRQAISREWNRVRRLRKALEGDLERIREPEPLRRRAEALLAGLSTAEVEAGSARVQDPYGPEETRIVIPLPDPARSLPGNAEIYFRKFRKALRARVILQDRLPKTRLREAALQDLVQKVGAIREEEGLGSLETQLESIGIVRRPTRRKRFLPPGRGFRRLRRVTSPDGWIIYIGRNSTDNQYLTFRLAGERDFWLHAAEVSGSHVIVRNPSRRKALPDATLRMAAEAAAFYSGARKSGRVEVHLAIRKDIRKGKESGRVHLKRYRSVLAKPRDPLGGSS